MPKGKKRAQPEPASATPQGVPNDQPVAPAQAETTITLRHVQLLTTLPSSPPRLKRAAMAVLAAARDEDGHVAKTQASAARLQEALAEDRGVGK